MKTASERKAWLESVLSKVAGVEVGICIRGEREFTFHYEGRNDAAAAKLVKWLGASGEAKVEYDADIDFTCIFVTAKGAAVAGLASGVAG